jgi:hypothetical protein
MPSNGQRNTWTRTILRAAVEIAFILFLFYANLLMGEFTRSAPAARTLAMGLHDIFTYKNFGIALVAASVGYFVFERLRRQT